MNSKIPTFSVKKPTAGPSRLAAPSTIKRPSSFVPKFNATSTVKSSAMTGLRKPTHLATGIKRPLDNPGAGFSSVNKFKRTTPLSLARSTSKETLKPAPAGKVATRLDFSDNFRTPLVNKNSVTVPKKVGDENETSMAFMANFQKTEKPLTETKSTSPIVDWKTLTKESEMISYKVKISALQKQIDELNCENSQLRIRSTVTEEKIRSEVNEKQRKIKELNDQIKALKENEEKLREDVKRTEEMILENSNLQEKVQLKHESEVRDLKSLLDEAKAREQSTRTQLSSECTNLKHEVKQLRAELEFVRGENEVLAENYGQLAFKEEALQTTLSQLETANATIATLQEELKSYQEGSKLQDILEGELSQLKGIKDENTLLKQQLDLLSDVKSENMILNEKIIGLESEVELLKSDLTRKNVDAAELSYSKKRLHEWMEIVGADTPELVMGKIANLNQEVTLMRMETERLKSELKISNEKHSNELMAYKTQEVKLTKAKDTIKVLSEQLQAQRRSYKLLEKERDSLKSSIPSKAGPSSEATSKIAELESLLTEYKQSLASQEDELVKAKNELTRLQGSEHEIELLKSEIARIKELNPHIYTTMSPMDVSTVQTNEKAFRVIHFKHNPVAIKIDEAKQQHAELEEENRRLQEENKRFRKIVDTVERTGDSADLTRQVDESSKLQLEVVKLQKLYTRASDDLEKLKETYRNMTRKFRTACYRLTGFQINNLNDTHYQLKHQYETEKNELIFEVVDRRVQIQDCSAAKKLQEEIQTYLVEHNSCPAFLAAYTMELFKRKTLL